MIIKIAFIIYSLCNKINRLISKIIIIIILIIVGVEILCIITFGSKPIYDIVREQNMFPNVNQLLCNCLMKQYELTRKSEHTLRSVNDHIWHVPIIIRQMAK